MKMQKSLLKKRSLVQNILLYSIFLLLALIILFPVYWIIVNSLKDSSTTFSAPTLIPQKIVFENYVFAFQEGNTFNQLMNTIWVSSMAMLLTIFVAVFAVYSITRLEYKGKPYFMALLSTTQVFPIAITIVPLYLLFRKIHLYNNHTSLILTYTAMCLPIAIVLMSGYFKDIPKELEEAATIDGCGRLKVIWKVILPNAMPGIVATGVYVFLSNWQEYFVAVSLISDVTKYTLTLGLTAFQTEHSVNWGAIMAVSVIIALPAMILFASIEQFFIDNLSGSVKG